MANTFDYSGVSKGLSRLSSSGVESLARHMLVKAGSMIRDEAKERAPVGAEGDMGSITPGLLKSSIYLAYSPQRSTKNTFTYIVSWNSKKAPHGHLVEFGHWMKYPWFINDQGEVKSVKSKPFKTPRWVAAHPFLRPAFDATRDAAGEAAIEEAKRALPSILKGET